MPREDKPYRVYRGGRAKGGVPTIRRQRAASAPDPSRDGRSRYRGPGPIGPERDRLITGRRVLTTLGVLFGLLLVWAVASYLSLRSGVQEANARVAPTARAALAAQEGLLISRPTTILVLGTDFARYGGRSSLRHADSMMLVRTDPDHGRIYYLSFPRDLLVPIPGQGRQKINFAFQAGGAPLTVRTVTSVTGIEVNHLVLVQFESFREVVDAMGGVEVDVPKPVVSKFECPLRTPQQCAEWDGWRFARGKQELDGRRALVYARVRANKLEPGETDVTRTARQQQVLQAISDKVTSPLILLRMPFIGGDLVRPLATDLSSGQLLQLGWVKARAGKSVRCRLGGEADGSGSIVPQVDENLATILMFKGEAAPQPPKPWNPQFGPGCVVGDQRFR